MKVYLYLLDNLSDWEIGFLCAELYSKRYFKEEIAEKILVKVSLSNEAITTMGGINILPDTTIDEINLQKGDILVLPGSDSWSELKHAKILDIAVAAMNNGAIVAAICGASIALANTGALDKRKHTSNAKEYLKMVCPNYNGDSFYIDEPAVFDDNLITASGLAPLEFTYKVLEKTNFFRSNTLEAWLKLYQTRSSEYFFTLLDSLK